MRVLLFDLDGVLVDSRRPIASSIRFALARHGLRPPAEETLYRYIGAPLRQVFAELVGGRGPGAGELSSCIEAYRRHYERVATRDTVAVAGIAPVLARLAADWALGVATSKPVEFAEPILEAVGLRHRFAHVTGPALDAHEPKPETLGRALVRFGRPKAVGYVGDTRFDVEAARAHGVPILGVQWGIGSAEELEQAGADALAERPEEIVAWAESIPTPMERDARGSSRRSGGAR